MADFLPPPGSHGDDGEHSTTQHINRTFIHEEEEPDPFVFNTTACYTVLPEKVFPFY